MHSFGATVIRAPSGSVIRLLNFTAKRGAWPMPVVHADLRASPRELHAALRL